MEWYPSLKTRADSACPPFVDLVLWEADQVQEAWVVEGSVGPEVMAWRDGLFADWWPCLTIERAQLQALRVTFIRSPNLPDQS